MNHLDNHPDNLLPNNFTLTLDTHFVASMILFQRYGQAPIRVIRKSRPDEYGHQRFYDRLGYVYAYSGHVDADDQDPYSSPEARRRFFLDAAGSCLRMGKNVIVCPEGACAATEESPRAFRPGAFRLAAHIHPEPLLVPIAVANFDKQLTRTTTAAVVHEPFRLSDAVGDPADQDALLAFINHQLGPASAAGYGGPPRWPGHRTISPKALRHPGARQLQPAPLDRPPASLLEGAGAADRKAHQLVRPAETGRDASTVGAGTTSSTRPTPTSVAQRTSPAKLTGSK